MAFQSFTSRFCVCWFIVAVVASAIVLYFLFASCAEALNLCVFDRYPERSSQNCRGPLRRHLQRIKRAVHRKSRHQPLLGFPRRTLSSLEITAQVLEDWELIPHGEGSRPVGLGMFAGACHFIAAWKPSEWSLSVFPFTRTSMPASMRRPTPPRPAPRLFLRCSEHGGSDDEGPFRFDCNALEVKLSPRSRERDTSNAAAGATLEALVTEVRICVDRVCHVRELFWEAATSTCVFTVKFGHVGWPGVG